MTIKGQRQWNWLLEKCFHCFYQYSLRHPSLQLTCTFGNWDMLCGYKSILAHTFVAICHLPKRDGPPGSGTYLWAGDVYETANPLGHQHHPPSWSGQGRSYLALGRPRARSLRGQSWEKSADWVRVSRRGQKLMWPHHYNINFWLARWRRIQLRDETPNECRLYFLTFGFYLGFKFHILIIHDLYNIKANRHRHKQCTGHTFFHSM